MYHTQYLRVQLNKGKKETYLLGDCEDSQGHVHSSKLRLDDCIGDRDGKNRSFFLPLSQSFETIHTSIKTMFSALQ